MDQRDAVRGRTFAHADAVTVVDPERFTMRHPVVQATAAHLGIPIGRRRR